MNFETAERKASPGTDWRKALSVVPDTSVKIESEFRSPHVRNELKGRFA